MIPRPFWLGRIEKAWVETSIVWLSGVRRAGKTTIAQSLGDERIRYINCDLPIVAEMVTSPELFYKECDRPIVVFDEIHQLRDPARLLKIGADMFPRLKIMATGSSTLAASRKFRDTLTGRKRNVHLTPVLWNEFQSFGKASLLKRLYHGGLPEPLLSDTKKPSFFREWMDSFFARDIQRLFAFREPDKFQAVFEFVMKQSGGLFEVTRTSRALGIGRPTIENHIRALEATHVITKLGPFYGSGQKEIVRMPKVYAFDTGFVSFSRGWDPLRPDDFGLLWEHLVLDYLQAHSPDLKIRYWRDASGREIDFIIPRARDEVDAIECKWDPQQFEPTSLKAFRERYTKGANYLVSATVDAAYWKQTSGLKIFVCNPDGWLERAKPEHIR